MELQWMYAVWYTSRENRAGSGGDAHRDDRVALIFPKAGELILFRHPQTQPKPEMNDKQLEALARKNAAKTLAQPKRRPVYDATLEATRNETRDSAETTRLFKEMKRREF